MKILLNSPSSNGETKIQSIYDKAIVEAIELFVVSAYLTDWQPTHKLTKSCQEISFIVGTDFGITTKAACRAVLKWLPTQFKSDFRAADHIPTGFHPKFVLWKDVSGQCYLLLGSSNLTKAAFMTNYEANVFSPITSEQFEEIKKWVLALKPQSSPISEDWLVAYEERSKAIKRKQKIAGPIITFQLPDGVGINEAIQNRRKQQAGFARIREQMTSLIIDCADGKLANAAFYEQMMNLWGNDPSRFQGRGFEIKGKHTNWQDVCKSVSAILSEKDSEDLDGKVRREIDRLANAQNAARTAWLSEILCHYFPDRYPLVNKPINTWLRHNKYRAPLRASEGARYIDLALKLRGALQNNTKSEASNLAELDHSIWHWWNSTVRK
jgi:hypothetical protein